ncbi:homoserine O-acetyltransferase family protein [Mongoliitalea daihaiensis]|uniref:homoserine O-acetyltransferase family protein n=1 Tax=Mongoliitalea daihaiensis TaxID=2782006 RepID=UPI001F211A03|nr:homoserine O-acetyltransferase [Mongoliitalea daihaiensis]UJP63538.1 homoserine O-acetyltransferase [Mongoliitalea daihaiensis]
MNLISSYYTIDMSQDTFIHRESFTLESGEVLPEFELSYTTMGNLNASKDNVIWVIHALTGDAKVSDWWSGLIGEDRFYDPSKHFIICANLLGSSYGSTSPLSVNPITGDFYYYDFPHVTPRDMANSLDLLRQHLEIESIDTIIGGSLGGQVGLEWSYLLQDRVRHSIIIASNAKATPWIRGFNETQRMAIASDCTWGERQPNAGKEGLKTARAIAMLSYRHPKDFELKQEDQEEKLDNYRISSYLQYQGQKLSQRFNAFSYWALSKSMDSHDLGRKRGGLTLALQQIPSKVLAIGVDTDMLFLKEESQFIAKNVPKGTYREISSHLGHDAFLIEYEQMSYILSSFYLEDTL